MSFKVDIGGGRTVTCETPDDVINLIRALDAAAVSPIPQNGHALRRELAAVSISSVVRRIPERGQTALRTILSAPNHRATDSDLRAALHVRDNVALAGALSAITREAARAGIDTQSFFQRRRVEDDPRHRFIEYSIPGAAIEEVERGLNM